jgi:hypothetical protein
MATEQCMCGYVGSVWEDRRPFEGQRTMHSPFGCIRRIVTAEQLKFYIEDITGFRPDSNDLWVLFQCFMNLARETGYTTEGLTVFPVPLHPVRGYEETPNSKLKRRVRYQVPSQKIPNSIPAPGWNPETGTFKPPWVK